MGVAPMSSLTDPNGDTMRYVYNDSEELTTVYDTYGRPYQYGYDPAGDLLSVVDYLGRTTRFTYDAGGNLSSVTSPSVTGTPTGNNFPNGMTTRFTYDANHRLLTVTSPNEVADNGPPSLTYSYDAQGRVQTLIQGGTDVSGVPSGGTITYQYQTLGPAGPGDYTTPTSQTTVTDRDGNVTQHQYNQIGNVVDAKQETRGLRAGDPADFETRYQYDQNYRLTQETLPDGNAIQYTYDTSNPRRTSQGDLLSVTETPDAARGGDQSAITTTYTYEPIYNKIMTTTDARGNDPSYVPQNGGAISAARYTTTYTYDYQEGTNFAALGQVIGLNAAQTQAILALAGVPMGLGDVNGDGQTNQTAGNLIRLKQPSVTLLPGSNEAAVEGTTSQPVVTKYTYNSFGQATSTTDPEGNVTTYTYYPARDPNGDGIVDNPSGDATTGGYLKQAVQDSSAAPGRDSGTNPAPAAIRTTYQYDAAGNMTRQIDGRGVATDYVYNQDNQLVVTIHAAATGLYGADPGEPSPLTAFRYVEMYYYDFDGNMVMDAVEDRGNTSGVQGSPPGAIVPPNSPGVAGADPVGGSTSFEKTINHYDILGHRTEMDQEVSGGSSPVYLDTRYRYDPDGNLVLTILPEGNATATIYDERNLVLRTILGGSVPPEFDDQAPASVAPTLLAPGDQTNYDIRGGSECQCTTYRYDANGNVIETVSDDDNDLSPGNNDPSLGEGDRTLYTYDGFDRRTSVIDAVGNQTVYQYDPAGNLIRTSRFGPVDGPSPTSNGPNPAAGPVSMLGVIQAGNLVNGNLLSATEYSYDELGRLYQSSQVLFVNTIPTSRAPDVAEGGSSVGLGDLTPGQTQAIPGVSGVSGVTILGRVSDRTEYDRDSRPTFRVEDDTNTSRTFYDGAGRVIETVDPDGNTVETAYDADSNVIETRETDVSQVPGVANESFLTTNYYDSLDRLQQSVDNLGETTSYRYDSRGDLVATADADGPVNGPTISRRAFSGGALTVNTTNGYGNVTVYDYDGLSRRVREEQVLTASGRGDGVHIGASIYGVKNDPSAPESSLPAPDPAQGGGDGLIRTGWNYDNDSLLSSLIDDDGNVTLYLYDDQNRRIAEVRGLTVSSTLNNGTVLGDRVVPTPTAATIDDPDTIPTGQITAQLAEAQGRLAAVAPLFPSLATQVNSPPQTTVWGYSPNGLVLIYQDANGSETFTKYDADGRPIAERTFRAGQADSFAGDPIFAPAPANPIPTNGSTAVVTGTNIENFRYDGLSRLTYAFDDNDPISTADDSTVTDAYDSLGRVIEETQGLGAQPPSVVSSAWRADALRSALTYPNGRTETYTYDKLDRLKTVSDQGSATPIAQYDYIGVDRVLDLLYPQAGTRQTFLNDAGTADIGYDGLRRPVEERALRSDNSLIVGFTYTYDRVGNKLTEAKLHDPNNSETYTYDSAYRLLTFNRGVGGITPSQTSWTYDGAGNAIQVGGEARQYSSTNELIQRQATTISYDPDGNQTDDGTFRYTYDSQNRLRTVTRDSDNALIAVYSYDALGRRVQKVVFNDGPLDGTTDYAFDRQQDIEEHNAPGVLTQQSVFGSWINQPLVLDRNLNADATATGAGDQRLFYEANALGSVYALTDLSGLVVEGYQYDAFGRQTVFDPGPGNAPVFGPGQVVSVGGASLVGNTFLFAGMQYDPETGLYYVRARYYNADQGRFLQQDPAGYEDGTNLYEYALDRPTVLVDPSGQTISVCCDPVTQTRIGGWILEAAPSGAGSESLPDSFKGGRSGPFEPREGVPVGTPTR